MSTHNMGFYEDLTKIYILSLNYHQIRTLFLLLTFAYFVPTMSDQTGTFTRLIWDLARHKPKLFDLTCSGSIIQYLIQAGDQNDLKEIVLIDSYLQWVFLKNQTAKFSSHLIFRQPWGRQGMLVVLRGCFSWLKYFKIFKPEDQWSCKRSPDILA